MKLLPFEYATRNLLRSPTRLTAGVLGCALVVLLILAAAAFVRGMTTSLALSGNPRNVLILGVGSEDSAERSQLDARVPGILAASLPGIRTSAGIPHVSPEVHVALPVRSAADGPPLPGVLRGVTPAALLVHSQVQIVAGRLPRAGFDELMVGELAATRLGVDDSALALDHKLWIEQRPWRIVGRFAARGSVMSAELWAPLSDLQVTTRRDTVSTVVLTLDQAEFADIDVFCKQRLDLELVALREADYYGRLTQFYQPIRALVWVSAGLIALGGLLGGLNTLYAGFAARIREFGTLQTLGFSRSAIALSLVQEAALLAAIGALLATGVALPGLDGLAVRFSMGAFGLRVDSTALLVGLLAAALLGVVGALPPAVRCLRVPMKDAIRMN